MEMTRKTTKPKTKITLHRALTDQFDRRWAALSEEGVCDAIGGMEYERVRREWVEGGRPAAIDDFISRRANVGPQAMTLREIHDYITPLLADESMAAQDDTLVIHTSDGDIVPHLADVKAQTGGDEEPTEEELEAMLESIPLPGASVRYYTSKARRSYMDGAVTDFIDNPANDCSEEPQVKVWFTSRVVRGGSPAEISRKLWLPMSALEVLTPADTDAD